MVELLLGAGANPDLQDKVRIVQNHCLTAGVHHFHLFCMMVFSLLDMVHTLTVSLLLNIKQYVLAASCSNPLYPYDGRYMCVCVHLYSRPEYAGTVPVLIMKYVA